MNELAFSLLAISAVIIVFVSLVSYIITAYSTMKIAINLKYDKPWLAWIPLVNQFMPLILIKNHVKENILKLLFIGLAISLAIPFFGDEWQFISLIGFAISMYAYATMFKWYSKNYIAHIIIAIFTFSISIPISLFMFRNRIPVFDKLDLDKSKDLEPKDDYPRKPSETESNKEESNGQIEKEKSVDEKETTIESTENTEK